MDEPIVAYTTLPDATPESELDALAAVYGFILDCHERKVADATGDLDEVKEVEDIDPTRSLPEGQSIPTGHP